MDKDNLNSIKLVDIQRFLQGSRFKIDKNKKMMSIRSSIISLMATNNSDNVKFEEVKRFVNQEVIKIESRRAALEDATFTRRIKALIFRKGISEEVPLEIIFISNFLYQLKSIIN